MDMVPPFRGDCHMPCAVHSPCLFLCAVYHVTWFLKGGYVCTLKPLLSFAPVVFTFLLLYVWELE